MFHIILETTTAALMLSRAQVSPARIAHELVRPTPATAATVSPPTDDPSLLRACLRKMGVIASKAPTAVRGNRKSLPLTVKEMNACLALHTADLFDGTWYLETYPDVAMSGVEPLHHLVHHGIFEGRSPNRQIMLQAVSGFAPTGSVDHDERLASYLTIVASLDRAVVSPVMDGSAVEDAVPGRLVEAGLDKGCLHDFSDAAVLLGLARFARFPLFQQTDYFALNQPLLKSRGLVAHRHAFLYGFSEGRSVFERHRIATELGQRSKSTLRAGVVSNGEEPWTAPLDVSVAYNTSGNSFLEDIAQNLVHDLRGEGHDAVLIDDRADPSVMREHNIIIAPHEFFFVGQGRRWSRDDVLARSVMFNTEQPQTIWFDRAVPFNMLSRGVIDMSPQVASMYAESMPAIHCDLSGPALDDVLPGAADPFFRILPKAAQTVGSRTSALDDRSLDVSFFGGISGHRDRFFSQTARFFSDYKTLFYCRRNETPLSSGSAIDLLAAARHAAFHSKIVLNIHRDEFGFFEWHRIVRLGIDTGALVISEPCLPHPEFKPNVHYFEESGRHIQNLVEWLLRSPAGQAEAAYVRRNALELVDAKRKKRHAGRRIAHFLGNLEGGRI